MPNAADFLDDGPLCELSLYLVEICEMLEEASGTKPSLEDLCHVLTASLQGCPADLLDDVDPQRVIELKASPDFARAACCER